MRHLKKGFKLGRTASHRKATLAALSNALIANKRITTTLTKAKALRTFVEPIISRSKDDTTHNRRQVFRRLQSKDSVKTLFDEIAGKVEDRTGGYTRVIRLGRRPGDGAELAVIELVDYNDVKPAGAADSAKTRRTRRAGRRRGGAAAAAVTGAAPAVESVVPSTEEVEGAVVEQGESAEGDVEIMEDVQAEEILDADATENVPDGESEGPAAEEDEAGKKS
jgi:large subunit ribosomal protein L17